MEQYLVTVEEVKPKRRCFGFKKKDKDIKIKVRITEPCDQFVSYDYTDENIYLWLDGKRYLVW